MNAKILHGKTTGRRRYNQVVTGKKSVVVPLVAMWLMVGCVANPAQDDLSTSGENFANACGERPDNQVLSPLVVAHSSSLVTEPYLAWGIKNNCFAKQGLDVSLISSGNNLFDKIAALTGGTADVGIDSTLEITLALLESNVSIVTLNAGGYSYTLNELESARVPELEQGRLKLQTVLLLQPDISYSEINDLSGLSIGISGLANPNTLGLLRALEGKGINSSSLNFVELSSADRMAAFDRRDLDGVLVNGYSALERIRGGAQLVLYPGAFFYEEAPVNVYYTTDEIAARKEGLLKAFERGISETNTELNKSGNHDSFKDFLQSHYGVGVEEIEQFVMPVMWTSEIIPRHFEYTIPHLARASLVGPEKSTVDSLVFLSERLP